MTAERGIDHVPSPDRVTYRVTFAVAGEPGPRQDEVTVVPGYSQEDDIPRILATRLAGGSPTNDLRITVLELHGI
ncbi:hypothetical protein [Kitasatospora sp. NPDC097643]|uniref:hypothetical protein n=1 Tax=Kitasatospora sp. NPDC097643 TaxID=3157230 RepID=UPI003328D28E